MRRKAWILAGLAAFTFLVSVPSRAQVPGEAPCILAATGEGWGLLSADQSRPFFEAPLPVDAAVPHVSAEVTNQSAIGKSYLADPGLVARAQVEAARPIPSNDPVYTVPQPVFPAAALAAQPGGAREASFGVGGSLDPTGQFHIGAARAEARAQEHPPDTESAARLGSLAFVPGPNEAGAQAPEDADAGPAQRGLVTVTKVATRSAAAFDNETGEVRGFAATSLSEVEIAGVVRIRSIETLAEAITDGDSADRTAVTRVDGLIVGDSEVPFDENGLAAANAALEPMGFELLPAESSEEEGDSEVTVVSNGLQLRGEHVDSSGERRRVNLILGYAKASSKCLPQPSIDTGLDATDGVGDSLGSLGSAGADSGLGDAASFSDVGTDTGGVENAAPAGEQSPRVVLVEPSAYSVRWDWSKLGVRFWPLGDIFTAAGSFAPFAGAGLLAWQRRRLSSLLG